MSSQLQNKEKKTFSMAYGAGSLKQGCRVGVKESESEEIWGTWSWSRSQSTKKSEELELEDLSADSTALLSTNSAPLP